MRTPVVLVVALGLAVSNVNAGSNRLRAAGASASLADARGRVARAEAEGPGLQATPCRDLVRRLQPLRPGEQRLGPPDVRYVPTPQNIVDAMLEMARVTAADVVYDLGSGDGRIPITAARTYGACGVGIEIEPRLIRESNDNAMKAGVAGRVVFLNQNVFQADLTEATVVTLFLLPRLNQELMPKLKRLRPGTRIVSHYYDMGPTWPPDASREINSLTIYLWTVR